MSSFNWPSTIGSATGVTSVNTLTGDIILAAGSGITITPSGNTLTFAAINAGTVTSVSVVSANGLAGTVATATSTAAITLSTSITGILKGNGTAISAGTAGTDYSAGTSALSTGILKSTTTTGALTIATAADIPVSGTSGGIPYYNTTTSTASSGLLTTHALVLGGGSGASPTVVASLGTSTTVLHGAAAGDPTWGAVSLTADVSGILPNANTTAVSTNTNSAIVTRDGSGNFAAGTITAALTGTASGNTTYSANNHGVVISGAANAMTVIAPDSSTTKILTSAGSSADPVWASLTTPYEFINLGLSVAVAANAMTINLKQSDGSTAPASGTGAVRISFRSATATTGGYNERSATAATTIVIPSGATLGQTSAVNQYVWVYAMDNGGTIELAVSGVTLFPDKSIQSSTTIGAGSTSGSTLYSTTGRASLPIRLIGRLLVNESTAGTWASNTTDIVLAPTPYPNVTDSTSWTPTLTGGGTLSSVACFYCRSGDQLFAWGTFTLGTVSATQMQLLIPASLTFDTSKMGAADEDHYGFIASGRSTTSFPSTSTGPFVLYHRGSSSTTLFVSKATSSGAWSAAGGSDIFSSSDQLSFRFQLPILGWSTYGP